MAARVLELYCGRAKAIRVGFQFFETLRTCVPRKGNCLFEATMGTSLRRPGKPGTRLRAQNWQSLGVAGGAGFWLFYVQHQFEGAYWERGDDWDYTAAALQGSSFYKLPKILQWFSGNIGFHHIHHLSVRIPNYNLERCHRAHPLFQQVKPVTFFRSFKSLTFRLWDEQERKLVSFRHLQRMRE